MPYLAKIGARIRLCVFSRFFDSLIRSEHVAVHTRKLPPIITNTEHGSSKNHVRIHQMFMLIIFWAVFDFGHSVLDDKCHSTPINTKIVSEGKGMLTDQ